MIQGSRRSVIVNASFRPPKLTIREGRILPFSPKTLYVASRCDLEILRGGGHAETVCRFMSIYTSFFVFLEFYLTDAIEPP
jgi:hypothetical protein